MLKGISVFCSFDGIYVCTDDFYATLHQRLCQIDCCLTAKGSDNSQRFFQFNDVHYILNGKRFKVQLIASCIIGRNGFGVVVDDDGFVTVFFDC